MRLLYVLFILTFLSAGCKERNNVIIELLDNNNIIINDEKTEKIDPFRILAAKIASEMDDNLLISQVLISGIDGNTVIPAHISNLLASCPAGGIMLFRYNLNTANETIRSFLSAASQLIIEGSGIPPFIAVDHEGGTVNRFMRGVAALPAASSYWQLYQEEGWDSALAKIEEDSLAAGREISGLGVNMNFAPVAEYLIEENKTFLESRSYGHDPFFTSHAAAAFVRGMEQSGIICVIKHFPASAGADPHYFASVLNMNKTDLDILVSPFAFLINNGVRAVMAAHTYVPQIDSVIASLSPVVMKNWLREELGFDGIIICDDFVMAAAGNQSPEKAAVSSIIAGADMVLVWPSELIKTHNALTAALEEGSLSRNRLLDAAGRIIYEKLRMGLFSDAP